MHGAHPVDGRVARPTNRILRLLAVITAIFAPLTLIAGIWGMNFERIPLADHPHGLALTVGGMALLVVLMLLVFWAQRFMSDAPSRTARWWPRLWRRGE